MKTHYGRYRLNTRNVTGFAKKAIDNVSLIFIEFPLNPDLDGWYPLSEIIKL